MSTIDTIILDGIEAALRVLSAQQAGVHPTEIDLKSAILATRLAREIQEKRKDKAVRDEEMRERMRQEHSPVRHEKSWAEEHSTYWGQP